ncbi:hypothetical protein YC2023_081716 [Brassica napus]
MSSAASKTKVINLAGDDEFVQEVEKVEEKILSGSLKGESSKGEDENGYSLETYIEVNVEGDLDEIELRPRDYDKEFWKPLLDGDYGGSNAVNVVFNEDKIVEGGGDNKAKVEKPEDYNPWMGGGGLPGEVNKIRGPTRYKSKSTSRIITAVYKAKFGDLGRHQ